MGNITHPQPIERARKPMLVRTRGGVLTFGDFLTISLAVATGMVLAGLLLALLWVVLLGGLLAAAAAA
jgi:hypothetical protein